MNRTEPAITAATVTALVAAVIALLVAFGVPLSDGQTAAILGVVAVVGPLAVGFLVRPQVTPNDKVTTRTDDIESDYEPEHAADPENPFGQ